MKKPDILKRGDIICVEWDKPTWLSKRIQNFQRKEGIPDPFCRVSHALVVSQGKEWIGYEMRPPRGNWVDIFKTYRPATLYVFRRIWRPAEKRMKFVDHFIYNCNSRYSWSGVLSFYLGLGALPGGQFCSMAVEEAGDEVDLDITPGYEPDKVSPGRLAMTSEFRLARKIKLSEKGYEKT